MDEDVFQGRLMQSYRLNGARKGFYDFCNKSMAVIDFDVDLSIENGWMQPELGFDFCA